MKPCCSNTIMNTLLKYMIINESGRQMKPMNEIFAEYGSQNNVFLTNEEYSALVREFSVVKIEDYIERLSLICFAKTRTIKTSQQPYAVGF